MKVSKEQASENRNAILRAAAAGIREHGFDQTSVAEVARAAGLTHGALYAHFKSKEALAAEATAVAFSDTLKAFTGVAGPEFLARYLSPMHRDNPAQGCPNASLVTEVWRQPAATREAFRDGLEHFVDLAATTFAAKDDPAARDRAIAMLAAMVGGLALSRAIRDVDDAASDDILRAVAAQLHTML